MSDPVTPNMGLTVPQVGTNGTPGPLYAEEMNQNQYTVDGHNHQLGGGVPINTAAIDIDADLTFEGFNATGLRSVRLSAQTAPLTGGSDLGCLYQSTGGDLWWNDGAGASLQLTVGNVLNAASVGGFTNLSGTNGEALFNSGLGTFTYYSNSLNGTYAGVNAGPQTFFDTAASVTKGVTVKSPSSLANAYAITLPTAVPGSTLPVSMSSAGALSTGQITNAQMATNSVQGGVSGTSPTNQIGYQTVVGGNIDAATIAGSNIAPNTVAHTNILSPTFAQSSSCGTVALAGSTSYATITNLTVAFTSNTAGKPVQIGIVADTSGQPPFMGLNNTPDGSNISAANAFLQISWTGPGATSGTLGVAGFAFLLNNCGSAHMYVTHPPPPPAIFIPAYAGSYSFSLQYKVSTTNGSSTAFSMGNACLYAWELC
jgi:hypothetical protein